MNEILKALKELIEIGAVEAARDEDGKVFRRNGEIVWAAVPPERLTKEQKALLNLHCRDTDSK